MRGEAQLSWVKPELDSDHKAQWTKVKQEDVVSWRWIRLALVTIEQGAQC